MQKVEQEYEGDYSKLLDLERATGLFEQSEDVLHCLQRMARGARQAEESKLVLHLPSSSSSSRVARVESKEELDFGKSPQSELNILSLPKARKAHADEAGEDKGEEDSPRSSAQVRTIFSFFLFFSFLFSLSSFLSLLLWCFTLTDPCCSSPNARRTSLTSSVSYQTFAS